MNYKQLIIDMLEVGFEGCPDLDHCSDETRMVVEEDGSVTMIIDDGDGNGPVFNIVINEV